MAPLRFLVVAFALLVAPSFAAKTLSRDLAEALIALSQNYEKGFTVRDDPDLPDQKPSDRDDDPPLPDQGPADKSAEEDFGELAGGGREDPPQAPEDDLTGTLGTRRRTLDREYHSGPTPSEVVEKMGNKDEDKEDLENMSREDLEEHLRKSTEGLEREDLTWTIDKALEDFRREHGEEKYRQFRRETRKSDKDALKLALCHFCDAKCVAETGGYGGMGGIKDLLAEAFTSLGIEIQAGLVMKPNKEIPTAIYLKGTVTDRGVKDMGRINDNFWKYKDFYKKAKAAGCDALVLDVADSDKVFKYVPNAAGVAGMLQICLESYATGQVSSSKRSTANIIAHEVAHLLGCYHDTGSLDDNYAKASMQSYMASNAANVKTALEVCNTPNSGCADGKGGCIMNPSEAGQSKFSACSQAYFQAYLLMAEKFPGFYTCDCLKR